MNNKLQNERKKRGLAPAFLKYIKGNEVGKTSLNDVIKQINSRLAEYEESSKTNFSKGAKGSGGSKTFKANTKTTTPNFYTDTSNKTNSTNDYKAKANSIDLEKENLMDDLKKIQNEKMQNSLEPVTQNPLDDLLKSTIDEDVQTSGKSEKDKSDVSDTKIYKPTTSVASEEKITEREAQISAKNDDENSKLAKLGVQNADKTNLKSSAVSQNSTKTENEVNDENGQSGQEKSKNFNSESDKSGESAEKSGMDALLDELDKINKEDFSSDVVMPDIKPTLGLEKQEEIEINEDALREAISDALTKKTNEKKEVKQNLTAEQIENIIKNMSNITENAEKNAKSVSAVYDQTRENFSMDALKRGLARSSIALLKIGEIDNEKAEKLTQIADDLKESLNAQEVAIQNLQNALDKSFSELDLELAEEIESELKKQIEELKEKQAEVLEFNNNVNKLEAEYQLKLAGKLKEADEYKKEVEGKNKTSALYKKNSKLYQVCKEYFGGLDRETAINQFMQTEELKELLGSAYYNVFNYIMENCK